MIYFSLLSLLLIKFTNNMKPDPINLHEHCSNCKKHFTPYTCYNCSKYTCLYCCESFQHYNNSFIHVCNSCVHRIEDKIQPYTHSLEFKIKQKLIKKLKHITLRNLNLKMIIQQKNLLQ